MSNTKKIICLKGKHDSGKTHSMIRLEKEIVKIYQNGDRKKNEILFEDIYEIDFVEILNDINGNKIGINSRGDDRKFIERWLEILAENKCNIIFCTCRSYGKTEEAVIKFAKKHGYAFKDNFVEKEREPIKSKQKMSEEECVKNLILKAGI